MSMTFPRTTVSIAILATTILFAAVATAQVIQYETNGQKYQTLTRRGLTVIVTHLPTPIAGFGLLQVSVSNGSTIHWTLKPEDFQYVRPSGAISALTAEAVVDVMLDHASGGDVSKLITSYERALYAIPNMRSTNGYEQRREGALSMGSSARLRAAAAASAIALALVRLAPGESTDGAVFMRLPNNPRSLSGGRIVLHSEGETFEFNPD
jgi:hypothetical protein